MSTTSSHAREQLSRHSSRTLEVPEPAPPAPLPHAAVPVFSTTFFDPRLVHMRKAYIKSMIMGTLFMTVVVFGVFSIYWGALWKVPDNKLSGWIVDFDGQQVGSEVAAALLAQNYVPTATSKVFWAQHDASEFEAGPDAVAHWIVEQKAWVAVVIHANATTNLMNAAVAADASYNGSQAITIFAEEARNENAYRVITHPYMQAFMNGFVAKFAMSYVKNLATTQPDLIPNIIKDAPQIVTLPIGYTLNNLRPFDVPVGTAITFVGLIYVLVLCFVIVQIGAGARFLTGLDQKLSTPSLIKLRLFSVFFVYFFISLFYSSLSSAFQAPFDRHYGKGGFVIFWMLNYVAMLGIGLAMESMITIMTPRFIPFFVIFWFIINVAVCFMPIEILPTIYHYGYATPYYHVSCAVRSLIFSTKNTLGLNFAVLIIWAVISIFTLPLFQWFVRRKVVAAAQAAYHKSLADEKGSI